MKYTGYIAAFFLILNISGIQAQHIYRLKIIDSLHSEKIIRKLDYKKEFNDSVSLKNELQNYLLTLYDNGYIAASFDSIANDSTSFFAYLNLDKQYKWAKLKKGNLDPNVLRFIGFKEKYYNDKPISYDKISYMFNKLLTYYENNAYPFAFVQLDSISFNNESIEASINLQKNRKCLIDSIIIKGESKISHTYIYNTLDIKPGDDYNESTIKNINTRLRNIAFVQETRPFQVVFSDSQTKIILYLEDKKANQFDGVIGFLPKDEANKDYKLTFTGDIKLSLQNALKMGEIILFNWQGLQNKTQDLKTNFIYPFILNSPFGADIKFNMYKKDTTYINVNWNIGIQYLIGNGNYLKAFVDKNKSSVISKNITNTSLANINATIYGLGFKTDKLNNKFNPSRGYSIYCDAGAGDKKIKDKEVDKKTSQYKAELLINYYLPLSNRNVIRFCSNSAYIYSSLIYENELFRIGGINSLRGFDEQSINCSGYSIFSLEYRYLLERMSNIHLFVDGAYYDKKTVTEYIHDTPIGLGAGISFETKAGVFTINYAIGKQFNNPIDFRASKIHFGIVNVF